MYGYNPEDPKRQILNYYILLGKRHIFLQRSEIKPPSFDHFLEFVKDKLIGPALYAYNDAEFKPSDWKGIRMLCESNKLKDPMKVGRFGLGFKSVFHVTDLPSIMSTSQIGVIDPHEKCFGERRTGYSWDIRNGRDVMNAIPDQFAPYRGVFDLPEDIFTRGSYTGTLFRFPLRTEPSKLSETLYSAEKVNDLFNGFMADAHLVLLFMQHLESIELYTRDELESKPRRIFQVRISEASLALYNITKG
ncbi:sacsin-like [Porites lutea]|uniref:sacsin-like n=1 Tax=Porites lutea TaxID=51062 RepID=UPI003CC50209